MNDFLDDSIMGAGFTLEQILRDATTSPYLDDAYYNLLRQDMAEWETMGRPLSEAERGSHEALILHENWLLDRRAWEQWLYLYTDRCLYWIPAVGDLPASEVADPQHQVTIAFDDRRRLGDRIVWLRTGVASAQIPCSSTAHLSSGFLRVPTAREGEVKIRSSFLCHEIRADHPIQTLTGWMGHVLVEREQGWKIDRKLVCLLDAGRAHHNLTFIL